MDKTEAKIEEFKKSNKYIEEVNISQDIIELILGNGEKLILSNSRIAINNLNSLMANQDLLLESEIPSLNEANKHFYDGILLSGYGLIMFWSLALGNISSIFLNGSSLQSVSFSVLFSVFGIILSKSTIKNYREYKLNIENIKSMFESNLCQFDRNASWVKESEFAFYNEQQTQQPEYNCEKNITVDILDDNLNPIYVDVPVEEYSKQIEL